MKYLFCLASISAVCHHVRWPIATAQDGTPAWESENNDCHDIKIKYVIKEKYEIKEKYYTKVKCVTKKSITQRKSITQKYCIIQNYDTKGCIMQDRGTFWSITSQFQVLNKTKLLKKPLHAIKVFNGFIWFMWSSGPWPNRLNHS